VTAETVTIRRPRREDLPDLVELIRDHARYERTGELRPDLGEAIRRSLFADSPRLHALLAVTGEETVGYASWSMEASTWQAAEYAHLDCLYLRDDVRGRGFGRMLLHAVQADARAAGAEELQWQTPAWNRDAVRFYRRHGAREAAKIRFTLSLAQPVAVPHGV